MVSEPSQGRVVIGRASEQSDTSAATHGTVIKQRILTSLGLFVDACRLNAAHGDLEKIGSGSGKDRFGSGIRRW